MVNPNPTLNSPVPSIVARNIGAWHMSITHSENGIRMEPSSQPEGYSTHTSVKTGLRLYRKENHWVTKQIQVTKRPNNTVTLSLLSHGVAMSANGGGQCHLCCEISENKFTPPTPCFMTGAA